MSFPRSKKVVSILATCLILICPELKRSSILTLLKQAALQMAPFLALRKIFFFPPEEFRVKVLFVLANEWDVWDAGCVCVRAHSHTCMNLWEPTITN